MKTDLVHDYSYDLPFFKCGIYVMGNGLDSAIPVHLTSMSRVRPMELNLGFHDLMVYNKRTTLENLSMGEP
jgi:hypothetical protein